MSRLWLWIASGVLMATSAGCATTAAVYDAVVPNPVAHVRVERDAQGALTWIATYGRDPEYALPPEMFSIYVHQHLDRSGPLPVPPSLTACEPLWFGPGLHRLEPGDRQFLYTKPVAFPALTPQGVEGCAYLLTDDGADPRRILFLDLEGRRVGEHILPREVPIADPRRLLWIPAAPLRDVTTTLWGVVLAVIVAPLVGLGLVT